MYFVPFTAVQEVAPLQRSIDTFHSLSQLNLNWHSLAAFRPPPFRLVGCLRCGMRLYFSLSQLNWIGIPWLPLLLLLSGCLPACVVVCVCVEYGAPCHVMCCLVWSVNVLLCLWLCVVVSVYVFQRWRKRQKMASHQLLYQQKTPQRPCQWNFLEASHFSFDFFSKVFFVFLILMLYVVVVSWFDNCYAGFLDLIIENWFPEWCGVADIPSCSQCIGFFSMHGETNSIYRHFKSCSITKSRYIKAKLHSKTSDYNLFLIGFKIGFL